ncbi:hypothetical protein [uncultured Polaribacter sp.]|uniref:hypothetical protein n=1 Tax=uncultured Polaribacter sp. TaxID=174711 RepID=UPI002625AD93|nr:hypothetical protein [uncultured Polaribacter sp.]
MTFGVGKSSDALLPEDQSVDYLLDNYANEIIHNYFFISSYDAKPNWMGGYEWKLFQSKPVKLGTLHHNFNEIHLQHEHEVVRDIFITPYLYSNVYGVFIKTHKRELKDIIPDYEVNFDYVFSYMNRSLCLRKTQEI